MSGAGMRGSGMTSERTRGRMVERLRQQGISDEVVLSAMVAIPRHFFIDDALAHRAYEDDALPIGFGQTISSPYIVARMIEAMRGQRELGRVLEVGTGCGYQAAVLSQVAKEVYSVERLAQLLDKVRARIWKLRIHNLRVAHADGYLGLAEVAPFDGIVVAAAAPAVPPRLLEQLAPQGRLVIPVGTGERQQLKLIMREEQGFSERVLEPVKFVPLLERLA
ncbi:MAG: protein-L-isoaspartate(D-aspartate) O-methyltransferase [Pseudomonadota bacterium]|nr:protein-L-isoaspartate(D-aspartate) O-methyltransferase [Pseudomonadota bacterium]